MGLAGSYCKPCTNAACTCKSCIMDAHAGGNAPKPPQHEVEEPVCFQGARAAAKHWTTSGNARCRSPEDPCMPEEEVLECPGRRSKKGMQMRVLSGDQRQRLEEQRVRRAQHSPLEKKKKNSSSIDLEEDTDCSAFEERSLNFLLH